MGPIAFLSNFCSQLPEVANKETGLTPFTLRLDVLVGRREQLVLLVEPGLERREVFELFAPAGTGRARRRYFSCRQS
jgi:hypothetical protein